VSFSVLGTPIGQTENQETDRLHPFHRSPIGIARMTAQSAGEIIADRITQILHLSQQATFLTRNQGFEARETA
jgi:hypothetical protein